MKASEMRCSASLYRKPSSLPVTLRIRSAHIRIWWVVEVDPDCDWDAGRGAEDDSIDAAGDSVSLVDPAAAGLCVVAVDDRGGAVVPAAAYLDAHTRIRAEVLDIAALATVFRDQPENVAVESVAHGGQSPLSGAPAGGLEQRERSRSDAES